jgi:transposase
MAKRFSTEFKQQSIEYALANTHESLAAIAKKLGVGYSTLDKWVRETNLAGTSKRQLTAEQQRILDLEKEVKQLREANDILKKAHVYFLTVDQTKESTR